MEQTSIILASAACDRILSDDDESGSIFTERERETEITIPPTLAFFFYPLLIITPQHGVYDTV